MQFHSQKYNYLLFIFAVISFFGKPVNAQFSTKDDVHLMQAFFRDATSSTVPYGSGTVSYLDYEQASVLDIGAQGGWGITPNFELGTGLFFRSINRDEPDGFFYVDENNDDSGIADLPVFGRYIFVNESQTKFSGGAFITLPIGSEDIGEGNTNFGFFGAVRHALNNQVVLTGSFGIDFLEMGEDRETALNLTAGAIIEAAEKFNVIPELTIQTETDYMAISGGVDYQISGNGHLRGAILLGVDDGAPDFGITGGVLFYFP